MMDLVDKIIWGDCLEVMDGIPDGTFQTCITSPPYWRGLRDYEIKPTIWGGDLECDHVWGSKESERNNGRIKLYLLPGKTVCNSNESLSQFCIRCGAWLGNLGLEPTPGLYVDHLVKIFREVKRTLRGDGTFWLNMGDSYCSGGGKYRTLKRKDLIMMPFRVALALQADGWWVRSDIIWHKKSVMPTNVKDRPTIDFEHIFFLAKSGKYFYNQDAIREPFAKPNIQTNHTGRNKRTVWVVSKSYNDNHPASFPLKLVEPMILAGSVEGDLILDPFAGSGTTGVAAVRANRHFTGIDTSAKYCLLARNRIRKEIANKESL